MKDKIISMILVVFVLAFGYQTLGKVHTHTYDDELLVYANVHNLEASKFDDMKVNVWIPELGIYYNTNRFDIGKGDTNGMVITVPLEEDYDQGHYLARVMVSGDRFKDWAYMYVTI